MASLAAAGGLAVASLAHAGTFTVLNTDDSGAGSLREAIIAANGVPGPDVICFDIPGPGPHTIAVLSGLPVVTDALTIDGWSEPDFTSAPVVELDGGATDVTFGLNIQAPGCVLRGLAINNFPTSTSGNGVGVGVFGGGAVWIAGCYIGVAPDGVTTAGNGQLGVWLSGSASPSLLGTNSDGTDDALEGNVIAANGADGGGGAGVVLQSNEHRLFGNRIGTSADGMSVLGNRSAGVDIRDGASDNRVGGPNPGEGNLISGNGRRGVFIQGDMTTGNRIEGNLIGTDATGAAALPNNLPGVSVWSSSNEIIGNTISGNGPSFGFGLEFRRGVSGNIVQGNRIGTTADGMSAVPNSLDGVSIGEASSNNLIGGPNAGEGNLISGNGRWGIHIVQDGTDGNRVQGNFIGTDATGSAPIPNTFTGVLIRIGAADNLIGGPNPGEGNLISGNGSSGVGIADDGATNNVVQGNRIGTDAAGLAAIPNSGAGVTLDLGAADNLIGGPNPGEENLISGNSARGVWILGDATTGNRIEGNLIGTDATGAAALGNNLPGVSMWSSNNEVVGNTISGNGPSFGFGLEFRRGASGNTVQGNRIGTSADGMSAVPNSLDGVSIGEASSNNLIGGPNAGEGNLISGNGLFGIAIVGDGVNNNRVHGNRIGTDATGMSPVPNSAHGVLISGAASENSIGGPAAGEGNVIAFNGRHGVRVAGPSVGNTISGNSIHSNDALGIALTDPGPTPNDPMDADDGPNRLQNYPVITTAGVTLIEGALNSTPNAEFRLEFFASPTPDPSGFGEGKTYLGATTVMTDAAGDAMFNFNYSPASGQPWLTATATDAMGNTSEFSGAVESAGLSLDVKPGSCPNPVNVKSQGVVPAAITGGVGFDVNEIDVWSLLLSRADGMGGSVAPLMGPPGPGIDIDDVATAFNAEGCECTDAMADGFDDLVLKFRTQDVVSALMLDGEPMGATVELTISGNLVDGSPFEASDCVRIVPVGDINADGMTTGADLGLLLRGWGLTAEFGPGLEADVNADGVVDGADLGLMIAAWGAGR